MGTYECIRFKGEHFIEFFNYSQVDATTLGNHEFNYNMN